MNIKSLKVIICVTTSNTVSVTQENFMFEVDEKNL